MEPSQKDFLPYLRPLLESPNSRYVLRDWPDKDHWDLQKYLEEGLLPSPTKWEEQEQKKSPVLVIANYANQGRKGRHNQPSKGYSSHLKLIDLLHHVQTRSSFQAYGPTRLLMWVPDSEKQALVPRTVAFRGKMATFLESAFRVEEIAGAANALSRAAREDRLDAESSKIVAQRMEEDGTRIPPERQAKPTDMLPVSSTTRDWHGELAELELGFRRGELQHFVGQPPAPLGSTKPGSPGRRGHATPVTPLYKRYMRLTHALNNQNRVLERSKQILPKQEEIDKLDLAAHRSCITKIEQEHEFQAMDTKTKEFKNQLKELNPKHVDQIFFLDDDRRALNQTPPLLSWDRRRAEPLIVQPDEFFAPKELALLDIQPLPPAEQFPMNSDQIFYFAILCANLLGFRGITTLRHLNHLAIGAYEALVPNCPALTDPLKGGRRDVDSLRTRSLTPEMLWQLAMAWDQWLFKPTMSELRTQVGASAAGDMPVRKGWGRAS